MIIALGIGGTAERVERERAEGGGGRRERLSGEIAEEGKTEQKKANCGMNQKSEEKDETNERMSQNRQKDDERIGDVHRRNLRETQREQHEW